MATAMTSDGRVEGEAVPPGSGRIAMAAALTSLGASFANFLHYHDYPLFKPEVALVVAGLLLLAAIFAFLHRLSPRIGKALLEASLIYLTIDLNSDALTLAAIIAGIAFLFRMGLNRSLLLPLTIVSTVVLLSAALALSDHRQPIEVTRVNVPAATRSNSVLHILLDEHGGSGGAEPALRREMIDFYQRNGFRLFDRGYARHIMTVNAVPDALNFGSRGTSRKVGQSLDVGSTRLLTLYEQQGYRLHVYQSEFADYCRYQKEASCTSYWSPSLHFIADKDLKTADKARLMSYKFAHLSDLTTRFTARWRQFALWTGLIENPRSVPSLELAARSGTLAGLAILDRMAVDLANARPGDAYFAHVLAPHFPYVADGGCQILSPTEWGYRRPDNLMAERRAAYGAQVRCVMKKVDAIIAAYRESPAGKSGTIIIHGDHGSRISPFELADWNRRRLGPESLMAGYSTVLAVRAVGVSPGLDRRATAVPDLLSTLARNDFQSLNGLAVSDEQVHLNGTNWGVGSAVSLRGAWPDKD